MRIERFYIVSDEQESLPAYNVPCSIIDRLTDRPVMIAQGIECADLRYTAAIGLCSYFNQMQRDAERYEAIDAMQLQNEISFNNSDNPGDSSIN